MTKSLKVSVIGAGAAGVFVAAALKNSFPHFDVELIFDPKLPHLGVGESLGWNAPGFFKRILGIENEREFLQQAGSTYKFGVAHRGYDGTNTPHLFSAVPNPTIKSLERSVLESKIWDIVHGDKFSFYDLWYWLYKKGLRDPKTNCQNIHEYHYYCQFNTMPFEDDGYARTGSFNYAYHINAGRIRNAVKTSVSEKVGVVDKPFPIRHVALTADGSEIDHLVLENNEVIRSDLYIDCTGFSRFLISKLPHQFTHCDEYINNRTIVGNYFYNDHSEHQNVTMLSAMDYGWVFHIPMDNRSGNGYQYNSRILDDPTRFVDEFHRKTNTRNVLTKEIKWDPGYLEECFIGNCLAIGTSQSMIDVFDSNNFTSNMFYIEKLVNFLKKDPECTLSWKSQFNYTVKEITLDILFRIQMAFYLAPRNDTPYWQAMKQAGIKHNTLERFKQTVFDLKRKQYVGHQNVFYQQNVYYNTAQYYGIDLGMPDDFVFEKYIEDLGLNQFNYMDTKNRIMAQRAEPMGDFYKRTIYKDLELTPTCSKMQFYLP